MWRGKRLLATGAVAALLALAVVGAAFAQAAPTPPAGSDQAQTNYRQYFLDRLASALGISRDELNGAAKTAANETIAQAQQDGKLSEDRADRLRQQVDKANGLGPWLGLGGPFTRPVRQPVPRLGLVGDQTYLEGVAKAFNLSVDELKAQLRAGKKVADLAQEKNVSAEQVKAAVLEVANARLDQAVANKRLTAEQVTKAKETMQALPAERFLQWGAFRTPARPGQRAPAGATS